MEVTSTEVQNNFGTYLKYSQYESINITRNGKIVAVLQGYDSFQIAEGEPDYSVAKPKLSLEEFKDFARKSDQRYELIDGEVFLLASPSFEHQNIVLAIGSAFREWSLKTSCKAVVAPFDIELKTNERINVVQPDVLILCDHEKINQQGRYKGTPTIVVEVLSRSSLNHDMVKKLELYRAGGVSEYWIVNPFSREIYTYSFADCAVDNYSVYQLGSKVRSSVFPTLIVSIDAVFA